ncbi:DUF3422 family protein [Sedimenticola thiotaurini]|uniref:Membrane protein n=1 Tax=Sedimenticola thiotaurini TaxID=1543721 RepID=A0A0F7K4L9_9GAMM|nr:DUF3422 domain-containing protein [Sedimenticola thiotaurini]AKH21923.1 membrane protein [Sedimenticola thiotaurini]
MLPGETAGIADYPLRNQLASEVHARPYEQLTAPVQASHLAILSDESMLEQEHEAVSALCERFRVAPPSPSARHHSADMGIFRLKWERHSEFSSYTFFCHAPFEQPFQETAISRVPTDWLKQLPGKLLAAVHLAVAPKDYPKQEIEELATLFASNTVTGSIVTGGAAQVWTDFHIHADGFSRFLIQDNHLRSRQAGRLVQRLCELEQYRMLALLAFPLAQQYGQQLGQFDQALTSLTGKIVDIDNLEDERHALEQLTGLAAQVEQIASSTSYRFSAATAYYDIILQRLAELREERIAGVQMLHEFMQRRLAPAMQTCKSVEQRIQGLSTRVARASNLLRTRVDVSMEGQTKDLLRSMDRRAHLQLRMQETVEGLSVVVLSYYLLGLVGYGLKGLKSAGIGINVELGTGIAIPVVVTAVFFSVRRLKRLAGHTDS